MTALTSADAWGYHKLDYCGNRYGEKSVGALKKLIFLKNVSNACGYLLSPLIGVIRMVVSGIFLYQLYQKHPNHERKDYKQTSDFFKAEIKRGAIEFFCLGIFLLPVDIYKTRGRSTILKAQQP